MSGDRRVWYPGAAVNLAYASVTTGRRVTREDLLRLEAVEPRAVEVQRNNVLTADTWSIDFDSELFPQDPNAITTALVDVFFGDRGAPTSPILRTPERRLIVGLADGIEVKTSATSRSTLSMKGRDYTSIFFDVKWGRRAVGLGRDVVSLIEEIRDTVSGAEALDVAHRLDGSIPVVPAGRGKKRAAFRMKPKDTVWDGMQRLAQLAGVLVSIEGDTIVVQDPRNVTLDSPDTVPVFVDGLNLTSLTISRQMTRDVLPNIQAIARNPRTGRRVIGRYPNLSNARGVTTITKTKTKGVKKKRKVEWREFRIAHPNPTTTIMNQIARRIWEGYAQATTRVTLETRDLTVIEQRADQPVEAAVQGFELSRLRNGTPFRLHVDRATRELFSGANSPALRETIARERGFKARVAASIGQAWKRLDRVFFVDKVTQRYSVDDGYRVSIEGIALIEV